MSRQQHQQPYDDDQQQLPTNPFLSLPFTTLLEIGKFLTLEHEFAWIGCCSQALTKQRRHFQSKRQTVTLLRTETSSTTTINQQEQLPFLQNIWLGIDTIDNDEEATTTTTTTKLYRRPQYIPIVSWTKDLRILVRDQRFFHNLTHLNMGSHASDEFLFRTYGCFPLLQQFCAVDSNRLSDTGLYRLIFQTTSWTSELAVGNDEEENSSSSSSSSSLWMHKQAIPEPELEQLSQQLLVPFPFRRDNLRYMDITYCKHTSYQTTLLLRQHIPHLIIRRQPKFMDGNFVTNFENDGIHTYWCDGTFAFQRPLCSRGYVMQVTRPYANNNPYHVMTKLQFTDFIPPDSWFGTGLDLVYHPGVSLLALEEGTCKDDNDENQSRTVLVAQNLRGLFPPTDWPKPEHADLPTGITFRFDRNTEQVRNQTGVPDDDQHVNQRDDIIVTRMQVLPLQASLMPPEDVVQVNREFFANRLPDEADLLYINSERARNMEGVLHNSLV